VVPDSKARTKIARDRNASSNCASAKNKAVAANKAVINEATSKANDKSGFIRVFGRLGQLPPFACPCADRLCKLLYNRGVHGARFCSYEIEHKG
jgi:hypothetical protein